MIRIFDKLEYIFIYVALLLFSGGLLHFLFINNSDHISVVTKILFPIIYIIVSILILQNRRLIKISIKEKWLLSLILLSIASILWSVDKAVTFQRGVAIIGTTIFGIYMGFRYSLKQQLVILGWTLSTIVLLSLIVVIFMPEKGLFYDLRGTAWQGIFWHKNLLGKFMVLSILVFSLLIIFTKKFEWKIVSVCFVILSFLLLIKSESITSLVVFTILCISILIFSQIRRNILLGISISLFVSVMLFLLMLLVYMNTGSLFNLLGRDATLTGRTEIWEVTLYLVMQNPIFGYGYGSFWNESSVLSSIVYQLLGREVAHAHNGFIDLMLQMGILGLLLFMIGYIISIKKGVILLKSHSSIVAEWPFLFLLFFILISIAESNIMVQNNFYWVIYSSTVISLNKYCTDQVS